VLARILWRDGEREWWVGHLRGREGEVFSGEMSGKLPGFDAETDEIDIVVQTRIDLAEHVLAIDLGDRFWVGEIVFEDVPLTRPVGESRDP
jgi:hypothetical protein